MILMYYYTLRESCRLGSIYWTLYLIKKDINGTNGTNDWNCRLYDACEGGNLDLVKLMI